MNIADLLDQEHVFFDVAAQSATELFEFLAEKLAADGSIPGAAHAVELLLKREGVMSTGIGQGIAVPHAFIPEVDHSLMAVALIPDGVEFGALDKKPVDVVFLLLGPATAQGQHLRTLARLSRILGSKGFVPALKPLRDGKQVVDRIREEEERLRLDRPRRA